jgi:nucleoside-diphosphate-sugar epimerase
MVSNSPPRFADALVTGVAGFIGSNLVRWEAAR